MSKELNKKGVPTVTTLPLPSSDSVLVIDLPDGQKYSLRMGTGGMTNRDKANYRQQIRRIIGLKPLKYALE